MVTKLTRRLSTIMLAWLLLATSPALADIYVTKIATNPPDGMSLLVDTNDFGDGDRDALLMFADLDSGVRYFKTWGRSVDEYPADIVMDAAGSTIIVGNYGFTQQEEYVPTPAFVVKFSPLGSVIWAKDIHWANYSIRLNAVVTDETGNIYATGQAWKYADTAEPGGWFAMVGYVFTVMLSPQGEVLWAKRWLVDPMLNIKGAALTYINGKLVVLVDYRHPGIEGPLVAMLWYTAADGQLLTSQGCAFDEEWITPVDIVAGGNGLVHVILGIHSILLGETIGIHTRILSLVETAEMFTIQDWSVSQKEWTVPLAAAAAGDDLVVVGKWGITPSFPDPDDPTRRQLYSPFILRFVLVFCDEANSPKDDSDLYTDSFFTSIGIMDEQQFILAGRAEYKYNVEKPAFIKWHTNPVEDVLAIEVVATEDENCGSSSFDITDAGELSLSETDTIDYLKANRVWIGQQLFGDESHIPDPKIDADVVYGDPPLTVNLSAEGSTIDIGTIVGYEWKFFELYDRDNVLQTASGPTASITYTEPGAYMAILEVVSDDGTMRSTYFQNWVGLD